MHTAREEVSSGKSLRLATAYLHTKFRQRPCQTGKNKNLACMRMSMSDNHLKNHAGLIAPGKAWKRSDNDYWKAGQRFY